MRALLQPLIWWLYKKIFTVHTVQGLDFIDIRLAGDDSVVLQRHVAEAMTYVSAARSYRELVLSELDFVGATLYSREKIAPRIRAYLTPFKDIERESAFYFACRLVWVASYLQLSRGVTQEKGAELLSEGERRRRSFETQRRFIRSFPGAEQWVAYAETNTI
jgi:hypothetical protein